MRRLAKTIGWISMTLLFVISLPSSIANFLFAMLLMLLVVWSMEQ